MGTDGIEPSTSFLSGTRSTTEPSAHKVRHNLAQIYPQNNSTSDLYVHNNKKWGWVWEKGENNRIDYKAFRNCLAGNLEKLVKGEETVVYDARRVRMIIALKGIKNNKVS